MESSSSVVLLLCDEEMVPLTPVFSSSSSYSSCSSPVMGSSSKVISTSCVDHLDEDIDEVFRNYLEKESFYGVGNERGYEEFLSVSSLVSSARFRAISWIFSECTRLNLCFTTAFNALNYLERFLSVTYSDTKWESWMMELLSIACLSIASKYEEVSFPSLQDFQMEEMEHSFDPTTIQRMELTVLKSLNWRLSCVTTYSYVELLSRRLHSIHPRLAGRTTEILIQALHDIRMLSFGACVIALETIRFALTELRPSEEDTFIAAITPLIPQGSLEDLGKCRQIITATVADSSVPRCCLKASGSCPDSPVTVLPNQRKKLFDCCADIDDCFLTKNLRKRKLENKLYVA